MAQEKREAILRATLEIISEHGFHDAPMSKIAESAGVGAGTIYRYFDDKETLINELFLELKQELSAAMLAGISEDDTLEEQFRKVWRSTFDYCIHHPCEMSFIEQFHNSPFLTSETEAATMEHLAPIMAVIQSGVEQGRLKPLSFETLTAFTTNAAFALAKRHTSGAQVLDQFELELAIGASWDAIRQI